MAARGLKEFSIFKQSSIATDLFAYESSPGKYPISATEKKQLEQFHISATKKKQLEQFLSAEGRTLS